MYVLSVLSNASLSTPVCLYEAVDKKKRSTLPLRLCFQAILCSLPKEKNRREKYPVLSLEIFWTVNYAIMLLHQKRHKNVKRTRF